MTLVTMVFAVLGFLSPANRGGLMTAMLLLFAFMGACVRACVHVYVCGVGVCVRVGVRLPFAFMGACVRVCSCVCVCVWGGCV